MPVPSRAAGMEAGSYGVIIPGAKMAVKRTAETAGIPGRRGPNLPETENRCKIRYYGGRDMKKILTVLTVICLILAAASGGCEALTAAGTEAAGDPVLEMKALELSGSSICFPMVTGLEDEELQDRINEQIRADLHVDEYLERMNALLSDDGNTITVTFSGGITNDVFSAVTEAEGLVKPPRTKHVWTAASVDLWDGHEITFGELFTDEDAAREAIETILLDQVAEDLSDHLENRELTPLPETCYLDSTGVTLLYDVNRLSTLKSKAGAVKIGWNEIRDVVDWSEDGIPARIGAAEMVTLTEESVDRIREMTESGRLPGIPAAIGDSVKEWTDRQSLRNDPDEFSGGRMFAPEGAAFRGVYLLSDAVSSSWDESTIQGIRMDRGCVWGLCIGQTEASAWHNLMGEPDTIAVFSEEDAENWRTVPGRCDYYQYGEYRLQLQYGEDGILVSVTLTK